MLRLLRFRLPALFLAGVVVSGLVAAVVAFQLFQSYSLKRAKEELRREGTGITQLYVDQVTGSNDPVAASQVERATGDRIYYVPASRGFDLFPGAPTAHLRTLPKSVLDFAAIKRGKTLQFEFTPPGTHKTYLAVARPLILGKAKTKSIF